MTDQWIPAPRSDMARMLYQQAETARRFDRISVEQVMAVAQKKSGLQDFGSLDFLPRLEVLVDSINNEARLNALGLASTGLGMPVDMLRARLELVAAQKAQPSIFTAAIVRPIFIVGGSRTGTTLLQRLLANDPRLRTPLLWEMSSPRTCALGSDEAREQLRNRVDTGQKMLHILNPAMQSVHWSEADGPEECVLMMGTDLRNHALMSCMNVPAYNALLAQEDFTESYQRHRLQLQLLNHCNPPQRWLLKAPYHLPALEALARAYPDACIIHTHRDVVDAVTSTCSLYSVFRSTFSDLVDPFTVGRQQLSLLGDWFNGTVVARQRLAGSNVRFLDVHYAELMADPLQMAERILTFAGLEPEVAGRTAMTDWLAHNRQGKHGGHRYEPGQFGLDAGEIRERMTPYRNAFAV